MKEFVRLPQWQTVLKHAEKLKNHANINILILGESGTGKEVLARYLHQHNHPKGPFVSTCLAGIPENLIEAELFGVTKGAYTGANCDRLGRVALANEGDLFLDEIGELPLHLQKKLLRFTQHKEYSRLGETSIRKTQLRIISATNRTFYQLLDQKHFRQDLLYRLAEVTLQLPPLREMKESLEILVPYLIKKFTPSKPAPEIHPKAMEQLYDHNWPGNLRELDSTIRRTLILHPDSKIHTFELLPQHAHVENLMNSTNLYQKQLVKSLLHTSKGNVNLTCQRLGISKSTLYRKLK